MGQSSQVTKYAEFERPRRKDRCGRPRRYIQIALRPTVDIPHGWQRGEVAGMGGSRVWTIVCVDRDRLVESQAHPPSPSPAWPGQ
jgi:hypothetical protein